MAVLAQFSDLHLGGDPVAGLDREVRLHAAVATVAGLDPPPDALLISGDISDRGAPEDYALVAGAVAGLDLPVHVLMGNHDDRAALRAAFPGADDDSGAADDAPYRISTRVGDARLLGLDTTIPGSDDGTISSDDLDWLEAALDADRRAPVILAMHHPPILTGIVAADAWTPPLEEREELASLLSATPQIRRVVCGHVHRTVFGRVGGCGVVLCPSISSSIVLDLRPAAEGHRLAVEPAGVLVHVVTRAADPITHLVPVH